MFKVPNFVLFFTETLLLTTNQKKKKKFNIERNSF